MKRWWSFCSFKRPYLWAFLLGAIYPLGLAPFSIWPLLWLSLTGYCWLLLAANGRGLGKISYCYGLGLFAVGASWVHVSIHQFGNAPLPLSIFLTVLFVAFLALFKALIGRLLSAGHKRFGQRMVVVIMPVLWFVSDYLQGIFLTGFPWLYSGYGLVDSPLADWLSWFGVLGMSFWLAVIAMQSAVILRLLQSAWVAKQSYWAQWPALAISLVPTLIIACLVALWPLAQTTPTRHTFALVQPNIPQQDKWRPELLREHLERYDRMTRPHWGSEYIIWPEAAIPALKHRVSNWLDLWDRSAQQSGSTLILGIPIYEPERRQIYASVITLGVPYQRYDKQHLVPFGEFVPLQDWLRGVIEFFNLPMSAMTRGATAQAPFESDKHNIFPAICYEIAFSELFFDFNKNINNQKDSFILTISNDAWFGRSFGPHQHLQIARARALEFGLPVVRGTNNGITAMIDVDGKIVEQLPQFTAGVLTHEFAIKNRTTFYAKRPLQMVLVLLVLGILSLLLLTQKTLKNKGLQ